MVRIEMAVRIVTSVYGPFWLCWDVSFRVMRQDNDPKFQ